MIPTKPPYLFNPQVVEERLASLPHTARLIHEKKRAGERSRAFPLLQRTDREIVRVLGRANGYSMLEELLRSLERCLGEGWDAHQLGSRDKDEFSSLMSDLQVAEHCLIRGFTLESPVGLDIHGRKPDIYARGKGLGDLIIEVFRPRELPAFHDFLTATSRLLMEVDIPYDYSADVQLDVVSHFNQTGGLVSPPHPICLDEALAPVAEEALARIAARLDVLRPSACDVVAEEWPDANLRVTVELQNVRPSDGDEPDRTVKNSKSYGGYDPVGMLGRLLPRIVSKAKKRQAGESGARTRLLICDLTATVVDAHLEDPHRVADYRTLLRRELEPQIEENYDAIALVEQRGWSKELKLHLAIHDDAHAEALDALFGPFQTHTAS